MVDRDPLYHLTLLRHGESVGNARGYYQGQSDFPLNETGRKQARALAERWLAEGQQFDLAISSPLARARETAEILTRALGLPLELDPDWMERDIGRLAGITQEEAERRHPPADFVSPYQPIGETGESQLQLYLRAGRALQNLLTRPPGRYLIVSHGGILNMALYHILAISLQANFQGASFHIRNAAFAALTYNPGEHRWRMLRLNDQQHWEPQRHREIAASKASELPKL